MTTRPRTHRADSALRRRDDLLRAATEIVGEQGASAATHRAVAARAGLPPATTTYFFSSIAELIAEALRTFVAERTVAVSDLTARFADERRPPGIDEAFASLLLTGDRVSELAQIEAYLHAARGPDLGPAVAEAMAAFEQAAEAALRAAGSPRAADGARAFVALTDGFVLQHLANPRPDDEQVFLDALRSLFAAYAGEPVPAGGSRPAR